MTTLRLTTLTILVACLGALLPARSSAYYVESRGEEGSLVPVRYADGDESSADTVDVTYRINTASLPAGVDADAVRAAFDAWSGAPCTALTLTEGATSDSTTRFHWMDDEGAIYILVFFTDADEEWASGPAAGHFFFAHDGTGTLVGGSVVLNSRDHAWATDGAEDALDVEGVVTALIGRSLGITSAMEGNATFPRYAPGDTSKRVLGADDESAIQFLYPRSSVECDAITPPEAECDGIPWPGDAPCPPLPTTMPGDGGTAPPRDAGPIASADAGVPGTDAGGGGGGDGDGGCSIASGEGSSRAPAWILLLGLTGIVARRRR